MSPNPDSPGAGPGASGAQRLGRYELLERVAVGGMGEVFLARERSVAGVSRIVVVKRLLPQLAEDPEQVALFIDEARITSQLSHPNIAQIYEFGVDAGVHFLAMEYVPGKDLAHLCERASRLGFSLSRELAIYVVAHVVRGLHSAHTARDERGRPLDIVHRDISPHNVLVSHHGDVKLMDFGIASAANRRQRTRTGVLRGKFAYMSPEQVEQKPLDARSDIFSAGVVLWETTLGQRLFAADTELETIRRVSRAEVVLPRDIDPTYPEALEAIVMTALAFDPADRFETAAAFESALGSQLRARTEDRRSLGIWVKRLFPDAAKLEANDGRVTAAVTAASDASGRVTASTGRRITGPAVVTQTDETPRGRVAAGTAPTAPALTAPASVVSGPEKTGDQSPMSFEPTVAAPRPRATSALRVFAVALPAALLVAVVSYFGIRALRGDSSPGSAAVVPTDAAEVASGPDVLADPLDASPAAAAAIADAGVRAVTTAVDPRRRATRRTPRPVSSVVDAGSRRPSAPPPRRSADAAPVKTAAPPPGPTTGKIAVDADPWGTVFIDGKSYGTNPVQKSFVPGPHMVSVRLSGGSGTVRASAIVIAGKKTKCRATSSSLVCRSPR